MKRHVGGEAVNGKAGVMLAVAVAVIVCLLIGAGFLYRWSGTMPAGVPRPPDYYAAREFFLQSEELVTPVCVGYKRVGGGGTRAVRGMN